MSSTITATATDRHTYKVWNVATEGRLREGADIYDTVMRGLTNQLDHGLPVVIPHGDWTLSDTIVFPYQSGSKLWGAGSVEPELTGTKRGLGTKITWTGADGGSMFQLTGENQQVEGITFQATEDEDDRYGDADVSAARYGYVLERPTGTSSIPTGNMLLRDIVFNGFDEAMKAGGSEQNCERCWYDRIRIRNCGTALRLVENQAMDHTFTRLEVGPGAREGDVAVHSSAGGHVHIQSLFMFRGTVFKASGLAANLGKNNGMFKATFGKTDSQSSDELKFVESTNPGNIAFYIENYQQSNTDDLPADDLAELIGQNHLEITNSRGLLGPITGSLSSSIAPTCTIHGQRYYKGSGAISELFVDDIAYRVTNATRVGSHMTDESGVHTS